MKSLADLSIVHCLSPAPFGGLESVVKALALGQRERGHNVILFTTSNSEEHPFVETIRKEPIQIVNVKVLSRQVKQERAALSDLIRNIRPDIVHTHGYRPDIIDLLLAQKHNIATVSTVHGFTGGDWKLRMYERLQLRALRRADAVIAVASTVKDKLLRSGLKAERVHVIPNSFRPDEDQLDRNVARERLGIETDRIRIGWIGRMSREKGIDVFMAALTVLGNQCPDVSIIGDGPDQSTFLSDMNKAGLSDRVMFHGRVQNAANLIKAFDLIVLSSRTEGTPMVLLEAMAASVPIIATAVGGIPDMLSDKEAALVPPEDPSALAASILQSISRPDTAAERAQAALLRLNHQFNPLVWLEQHDSLYRSTINAL